MRRNGVAFRWLFVLVAVALETNCTFMREVQIVPQSHFTPPNANVEPIGTVAGQASGSGLLPNFSVDLIEQAYNDALKKKGGDLLINIKLNRSVSYFTLLLFNIYTTTVTVDATAAKMTVGRQQISALRNEQIQALAHGGLAVDPVVAKQ